MLAVGLLAMVAGSAYQFGLPYLIPALRADGLSLRQASVLVSAPIAGLLVSLALWGAIADRWGERVTLGSGLTIAGLALLAATGAHHPAALGACLFVAGLGGASIHAASGRLILGWFAARERGLAMGVRQTGQPLGVGLAALALPSLAGSHGVAAGIALLAGCSLLAALLVAAFVRDPGGEPTRSGRRAEHGPASPPRSSPASSSADSPPDDIAGPPARRVASPSDISRNTAGSAARGAASPYRTPVLWRIHGASALLTVPQFAVSAFALVYLVDARGWQPATAGRMLAVAQLGAALARLLVGHWSDRAGSRLRPMRTLAGVTCLVMLALAVGVASGRGAATPVLFAAVIITVATNGLAYTAVAEYAGRSWAGRALGIQNTGQNLLAVATPPLIGSVVAGPGFATAFGAVVALPFAAGLLVPVRSERACPHGTAEGAAEADA
jgi:sugar phosphate permease